MSQKKSRAAARDELKNPDYTYVKSDLRRIFLISGVFIAVMIVLAFILR